MSFRILLVPVGMHWLAYLMVAISDSYVDFWFYVFGAYIFWGTVAWTHLPVDKKYVKDPHENVPTIRFEENIERCGKPSTFGILCQHVKCKSKLEGHSENYE